MIVHNVDQFVMHHILFHFIDGIGLPESGSLCILITYNGQTYFVLVEVDSKWREVLQISSTTSTHTINVLRNIFAKYGLAEEIVSDNGPQFTNYEFNTFQRSYGVKHIRVHPYHAASNGAAERMVQALK